MLCDFKYFFISTTTLMTEHFMCLVVGNGNGGVFSQNLMLEQRDSGHFTETKCAPRSSCLVHSCL